jgi:hypothetical protein
MEPGGIMALDVRGSLMRIAIVSDIHGNRTAFEAVLADLQQTAPDLIRFALGRLSTRLKL